MATVVTKEPPSRPCQFVAVWKYNGEWWSSVYQIQPDDSLYQWVDPGGGMYLSRAEWSSMCWVDNDIEAFFVYEEE